MLGVSTIARMLGNFRSKLCSVLYTMCNPSSQVLQEHAARAAACGHVGQGQTWVKSAASFPGDIGFSPPAVAQAAHIFQPLQTDMPHVTCTPPLLITFKSTGLRSALRHREEGLQVPALIQTQ